MGSSGDCGEAENTGPAETMRQLQPVTAHGVAGLGLQSIRFYFSLEDGN